MADSDWYAVTPEPIDPGQLIEAVRDPGLGGIVLFLGTVRDCNRKRPVVSLTYEAYEAMAVAQLGRLGAEIKTDHPEVERLAVVHRTGVLQPGDIAVGIACAAPHREAAFAATRRYIHRLKEEVPIWKKERYPDGTEWLSDTP